MYKALLCIGLFLILPVTLQAQSSAFGPCSKVMKTWLEIKSEAQSGADLEARLSSFRSYLSRCGYPIRTAGEITERGFSQILHRGYMNEYTRLVRGIQKGHSSGDLDRILFFAEKVGLQMEQVRPRLQSLIAKNKTNCQSRDYRSKLPPIRDQDSIGWCYGFTAADLLSFRTGKHVSALDTSLAFYDDTAASYTHALLRTIVPALRVLSTSPGIERKQGGIPAFTLRQGIQNGVCLESDLPSEDSNLSNSAGNLYRRLKSIDAISSSYQKSCSGPIGPGLPQSCLGRESELATNEVVVLKSVAPNLSNSELNTIVQIGESANLLKELRERSCKNRIPVTGTVHTHRSDIKENISSQLLNGNIVAIGYNVKVLFNKNNADGIASHVSSVVGQRWNSETHQCEFLLRNTWGPDCYYADSSYNCEPDGHIWIPSKILEKSISGVSYIK